MRRAARKDANHGEIEAVFRQMLGDHVSDLSQLGMGVGDLFVSFGHFPGCFIEIKRDAKADYTAHQIRFMNDHPLAVKRCESVEQAIAICRQIRRASQDIGMQRLMDLAGA